MTNYVKSSFDLLCKLLIQLTGEPDLTHYPFFLFNRVRINYKNAKKSQYRYSIFKIQTGKGQHVKKKKVNSLFNFCRSKFFISDTRVTTTLTKDTSMRESQRHNSDPKLLILYIDGFSNFNLNDKSILKSLMPNTYEFFKHSTTYENYYSTAEWTLPNVATILTGKLQNNHGLFFSSKSTKKHKVELQGNLIHEDLANFGLTTNVISAVPHINPNFKFHFGTSNFIYARNINAEGIFELYNYMLSELDQANIVWLHFMDIHHRLRDSREMNYEQNNWLIDALINGYRFSRKDAINFISRARSLDKDLAKLFKMESTNEYENIILVSDHGSTRLNTDWEKCLDDARAKTSLMVKCRNQKKAVYVKELTTHLSFIEIVYKLLELKIPTIKNKALEDIILIQSIYEGKPYRARIKGPGIDFNFVGSKSSGIKPYVNLIDIENLLNNSMLKSLSKVQQFNLKKLLLGG